MSKTIDEWHELLDNKEIEYHFSKHDKELREDGMLLIMGASDDLLETNGVFCDEYASLGGSKYYLTKKGLKNVDPFGEFPLVEAKWCPKDNVSWEITLHPREVDDYGHTYFLPKYRTVHIMEDDYIFCKAILVDINTMPTFAHKIDVRSFQAGVLSVVEALWDDDQIDGELMMHYGKNIDAVVKFLLRQYGVE